MKNTLTLSSYKSPPLQRKRDYVRIVHVVFSLAFIAGSLNVILSGKSDYSSSSPLNLALALGAYSIAVLLLLSEIDRLVLVLRENPLVVLIALLPVVSVIWSVDPDTTIRRSIAHLLTILFCIYLYIRFSESEFFEILMNLLIFSAAGSLLLVVLVPSLGTQNSGPNSGSWVGLLGQKNELGRFCGISIILGFGMFLAGVRTWRVVIGLAVLFLLLVGSQSRTNWLIAAMAIALWPMIGVLGSRQMSLVLRLTIFFLAIAIFSTAAALSYESLLQDVGRDATFSGRSTLWDNITRVYEERFPLFGAGYGAFFTPRGAVEQLAALMPHWEGIPSHAHNGYIQVKAELGYPGMVVLYLFIGLFAFRALRRRMASDKHEPNIWLMLLVMFAINNIALSSAFIHSDLLWCLMLLGYLYNGPLEERVRISQAQMR